MNTNNLPEHVAIIPDGNRRWAKKRGIMPWQGHLAGAETTKDIFQTALDLDIKCLSLWGGSWENLTERPKMEIKFLIKIYDQYFKKLAKRKELQDHEIKVNIYGRWKELLPKRAIQSFENVIEMTKDYNKKSLNFFIAYNGTDEMIAAMKNIAKEVKNNTNIKITPAFFKKQLWTGLLPSVDLLIRTGSISDPHNSKGFMMWHCAESQLHFAKEFYPDFNGKRFAKVIEEYQGRERRHGK
ncbi:MAG: polyprenyl diphosphate synthase [bacterium]